METLCNSSQALVIPSGSLHNISYFSWFRKTLFELLYCIYPPNSNVWSVDSKKQTQEYLWHISSINVCLQPKQLLLHSMSSQYICNTSVSLDSLAAQCSKVLWSVTSRPDAVMRVGGCWSHEQWPPRSNFSFHKQRADLRSLASPSPLPRGHPVLWPNQAR